MSGPSFSIAGQVACTSLVRATLAGYTLTSLDTDCRKLVSVMPHPEKSPYRHVGIGRFPVDDNPVSQDLATSAPRRVIDLVREEDNVPVRIHATHKPSFTAGYSVELA